MSFIPGGYALTTKRDYSIACKVFQTNLANRAQALYSAIQKSKGQADLTVYGYEQTTGDHRLDFIVKDGVELPLFEVQA
jgi:hypothetical protein